MLVEEDWWQKVQKKKKTHYKVGKSGKIIQNFQRVAEIKRKRDMIERSRAENAVQDKVWLPPDDLNEDNGVPLGKEYVKAAK